MWDGGFQDYVHDWWNLMDFVMNSLYLATISLKIVAYTKVIIFFRMVVELLGLSFVSASLPIMSFRLLNTVQWY